MLATSHHDETETLRHTVETVSVRLGSADVEVVSGARDGAVEVTRQSSWGPLSRQPEPNETWSGNTLEINEPECSGITGCSIDYVLRVPEGTTVDLGTGSGDITVGGALGAVTVEAGSGDIDSIGLRVDRIRAQTGSGEIHLGFDTEADQVEARAGSGDIDLVFEAPPTAVTVSTGSGDVDVELPDGLAVAITGDSGSGDRDIEVPTDPNSPRTLEISTGSGDVTVFN